MLYGASCSKPRCGSPPSNIARLANCLALHAPFATKGLEMMLSTYIRDWCNWRWRAVVCALAQPNRNLSLRELLASLEAFRNRTTDRTLHLKRLISLVRSDLALSSIDPARHGGPDVRRSMGAWGARYNHLDVYLRRGRATSGSGQDADVAARLSAAENEGWPLANAEHGRELRQAMVETRKWRN